MKKALIPLSLMLLLLVLLPGCLSAEAKEPVPAWPERLTGEYDDALTFTFRGSEPDYTGVDSQGGRLTALFATDGGYLALGWRRLTFSETELMEDFLAGTGSETGVWDLDSDPYSTWRTENCCGWWTARWRLRRRRRPPGPERPPPSHSRSPGRKPRNEFGSQKAHSYLTLYDRSLRRKEQKP